MPDPAPEPVREPVPGGEFAAADHVVGLDSPTACDLPRVGAKLARLAELAQLSGTPGIWVPAGFAITVDAFARQASRLGLAELSPARARNRLLTEPVERDVAAAIGAAYEDLCEQRLDLGLPVAVRSSAVGEDGAVVSFAGAFDTFLGRSGIDRVLDAVRGCWASLYGPRVTARGRAPVPNAMAVGVMELVAARASGVAFSVHPVTGAPDRVVIEANFGCGEAVVQGLVTPDHVEVARDGTVIGYQVNRKDVISVFDYTAGEVSSRPMPSRLSTRPVLDEEEVAAVAAAVRSVAAHHGHPVDVEWAISRHRRPGEAIAVLQARPVTALGARPRPSDVPDADASGSPSGDPPIPPEAAELPAWDPVAFAARYVFGIAPDA